MKPKKTATNVIQFPRTAAERRRCRRPALPPRLVALMDRVGRLSLAGQDYIFSAVNLIERSAQSHAGGAR